MSTLKVDNIENLAGEPFEPTGGSAWLYGASNGSVLASFNCSCSRVSTGLYRIVFDTPMPTANYATSYGSESAFAQIQTGTQTAQGFDLLTRDASESTIDVPFSIVVFSS